MFLDEKNDWNPPEPYEPPYVPSRGDVVVKWIAIVNVLVLCFAPIVAVVGVPAIKSALAAFAG